MLPKLEPDAHLPLLYQRFLDDLSASGFSGDIATDYATRLTCATDNSVYQRVPLAAVFPKHRSDVEKLLALSHRQEYREIQLSPRGGGTGTNGQSLSDGIMVDVSRYLRSIVELNVKAGFVRVEPGVVLDQLNAFLAPHGVFFAPNLSPSNRATLGGMIATDASGKGSRIYGKTSDHVLELEVVLTDGTVLVTGLLEGQQLERAKSAQTLEGHIYREVHAIVERNRDRVRSDLPKLERFLTGYDLAHSETANGGFDLTRVLCGSEGTLGVVTQAKLKLTPLPKYQKLVAIRYSDFDLALRAARSLLEEAPSAIETIDDMIVSLAKNDVIWHKVAHLLGDQRETLKAVNLVEFQGEDERAVEAQVQNLCLKLDQEMGKPEGASGYTVAPTPEDRAALWALRKKGVGLLGNAKGDRRPVPFVEDTAVPPENLANYIRDFRALLDRHGLRYGMFGHVDVGCLHVRPALNLRDAEDEALLHQLSDQVVELVKKYGGVLWGEHGRGYRSSYTPTFFGAGLYQELQRVKAAFDPHNQLNPGKLATPFGKDAELVSLKATKRGTFDRQITALAQEEYQLAIHCNGNGACFDWNPDGVMCPSSKVTRDRIHSPKGRAGILREWLRLLSLAGYDAASRGTEPLRQELLQGRGANPDDFSHQVYDAMDGCLACKACANDCPIKVDIPSLRSEFLERYHTRYRRPLKDYFVAWLERVLRLFVLWPKLSNFFIRLGLTRRVLEWVGIVDTPLLAENTLSAGLRERGAEAFDLEKLSGLSEQERRKIVCLTQDAFTTFYEPEVALAAYDLLTKLGQRVIVLPFLENGKALHVKGFVTEFRRVADRTASAYRRIAELGIPLVGIEPAVTLTYREEYRAALGAENVHFRVELLQEYLAQELPRLLKAKFGQSELEALPSRNTYRLFAHCTERTSVPTSQAMWKTVFATLGAELTLEQVGCCGMCGVYGHERAHLEESRGVFAMSWERRLPKEDALREQVLATGHSCRSQVDRFAGFSPRHPAQALLEVVSRRLVGGPQSHATTPVRAPSEAPSLHPRA